MSLSTLTPYELGGEARRLEICCWRATAAPPTRKALGLTATAADHDVLELLLRMPGLSAVSMSPSLGEAFVTTPPPRGSRHGEFTDPPVLEGSESLEGALHLLARERGRMLTDLPGLGHLPPAPVIVFQAQFSGEVLDLRAARFADPTSLFYGRITPEQAPVFSIRHLTRAAREAGIGALLMDSEGLSLMDWALMVLSPRAMLPVPIRKPLRGTLQVTRRGAVWRGPRGQQRVVPIGTTDAGPRPSRFVFFPNSMLGTALPFDGLPPYEC